MEIILYYLRGIKVKVVINMCSHFNFSFIWRCCDVRKLFFFLFKSTEAGYNYFKLY